MEKAGIELEFSNCMQEMKEEIEDEQNGGEVEAPGQQPQEQEIPDEEPQDEEEPQGDDNE